MMSLFISGSGAGTSPDIRQIFSDFKAWVGLVFLTFVLLFMYGWAGMDAVYAVFDWVNEEDNALFFLIFPVLGAYLGLILLYLGFHEYGEYNLIRNTPTSTIRSAPVGRVEVNGTVAPLSESNLMTSPFQAVECVAFDCTIEEYHHDDDGGDWQTVFSKRTVQPFFVEDGTGRIVVDAERAEWDLERDYRKELSESEMPDRVKKFVEEKEGDDGLLGIDFTGSDDYRLTSYHLSPGDELYVMGKAEPLTGEQEEKAEEAELKIGYHEATKMFFVSDSSESEITTGKWWGAVFMIVSGILLIPGSLFILSHVLGLI